MTAVRAPKGCEQCRLEGKLDPCCRFEGHRTLCADVECRHREAEHAPCSRKQYQFPIEQFNHRCGECGLYPSAHVVAEDAPCSLTKEDLLSAPPHLVPNGRCSACGLDVGSHSSRPVKRPRDDDNRALRTEFREEHAKFREEVAQQFRGIVSRELLLIFFAKHVRRRGCSAISRFGNDSLSCLLCTGTADHGCHVAEVRFFDPSVSRDNIAHLEVLYDWNVELTRWRRPMILNAPMNLVPLCEAHHRAFDTNRYLLLYDFLHSRFEFLELETRRTVGLPPEHQVGGAYELSHRAVAFRLHRIRETGSPVLPPEVAARIDELQDASLAPSRVSQDASAVMDDSS